MTEKEHEIKKVLASQMGRSFDGEMLGDKLHREIAAEVLKIMRDEYIQLSVEAVASAIQRQNGVMANFSEIKESFLHRVQEYTHREVPELFENKLDRAVAGLVDRLANFAHVYYSELDAQREKNWARFLPRQFVESCRVSGQRIILAFAVDWTSRKESSDVLIEASLLLKTQKLTPESYRVSPAIIRSGNDYKMNRSWKKIREILLQEHEENLLYSLEQIKEIDFAQAIFGKKEGSKIVARKRGGTALELESALAPGGTGFEPIAASQPTGTGIELQASERAGTPDQAEEPIIQIEGAKQEDENALRERQLRQIRSDMERQ